MAGSLPRAAVTERSALLPRADDEAPRTPDHVPPQGTYGTSEFSESDEYTTGQLLCILSGPWLGSFLAALDSTIIATLTASISSSFHSLSLLSWLASSYFIANAALQPLTGRLTDIFSRRTGLVISNILFAIGNLICGVAQDQWMMILGRVIAGCGGGGLTAISTFVSSDLIPLRRRGVWQGLGNITYGSGAALGAIVGGWINDGWGWRWAFLILVPGTLASASLSAYFVRIPVKTSEKSALRRIDYLGALSLIAALVLLLAGLNAGGNVVAWSHPLVFLSLALSFVFLSVFAYIESCVAVEPIIPVKLLFDRSVLAACLTNWFISMVLFSLVFYVPIYYQITGLTPTQVGIRLVPQSLGTAFGSITSGLIMRQTGRYYLLCIISQAIYIMANAMFLQFRLDSGLWYTTSALFLVGLGYTGILTVTLLSLISAVDHQHQAVITSASYAFRSTGSAIGIAISSAVFQNLLAQNLSEVSKNLNGQVDAEKWIHRLRDSLDEIRNLPKDLQHAVRLAYMSSLHGVFLSTLIMSIIAGVVGLAIREHVLHDKISRRLSG